MWIAVDVGVFVVNGSTNSAAWDAECDVQERYLSLRNGVSKLQSGMESEHMRDETLQFFSTARGCSYDVINVPLVELRN